MRFLKYFHILWNILLTVMLVVYSIVILKLSTPVVNIYSESLLSPVVRLVAPKETAFSNVILSWNGLKPLLVMQDLDFTKTNFVPGLKSMTGLSISIDIFSSIIKQNIVVQTLQMDEVSYAIDQPRMSDINTNLSEISDSIKKVKISSEDFTRIIPEFLLVKKINLHIGSDKMTITNLYVAERDDIKFWNFYLRSLTGNKFALQASLTTTEDDGSIAHANGKLVVKGDLPKAFLSLLQDFGVQKLGGNADIKVVYDSNYGLKANLEHNFSLQIKKPGIDIIPVNNIRGSSFLNIKNKNNIAITGDIFGANYKRKNISGFGYTFKINNKKNTLRISSIDIGDSYIFMPFLVDSKNKFYNMLTRKGLKGIISNINLTWDVENDFGIDNIDLQLADFEMPRYSKLPCIKNLNARLSYDGMTGNLEVLDSGKNLNKHIEIIDDRISPKPINVIPNDFKIIIENRDSKIYMNSENFGAEIDGIKISGDLSAVLSKTKYPEFNLHIATSNVSFAKAKELLPLKFLPTGLNNYLASSLLSGKFTSTDFWINSDNKKDSFDYKYNFNSHISGGSVVFAKGWPAITNVGADIILNNGIVKIDAKNLLTMGYPVDSVSVSIENFKNADIKVNIVSKILSQQGIEYLLHTPLRNKLKFLNDNISISGDADLNLNFDFIVNGKAVYENHFGSLFLKHNKIDVPGHNIHFLDANGEVLLNKNTVKATSIKAKLDNKDMSIGFISSSDKVDLSVKGIFNVNRFLARYLPNVISHNISGNSYFNVGVKIIDESKIFLSVFNEEATFDSHLPSPFRFKSSSSTPVKFNMTILGDKPINYDLILTDKINISWAKKKNLLKIKAPHIDYSAWSDFFLESKSSSSLTRLVLETPSFIVNKTDIGKTSLDVKFNDNIINAEVENNSLSGKLEYIPSKKLTANFDRISLAKATKNNINFSKYILDNMDYNIYSKLINYNGIQVKDFSCDIFRDKDTYNIKHSSFSLKDSNININGYWKINDVSKTYLEGSIQTNNFGDLLSIFPKLSYIDGGKGEVKFKLIWPQKPEKLSLDAMRGITVFNLNDGGIKNIGNNIDSGIGLGILLNTLSLQSIMNEISLDYAHLDTGHYPFNQFAGGIRFDEGLVKTDKSLINGPLGTILARGDVSTTNNDLDFYVTYLPNVTSSIPTIAALAGGVVAGVVAWTANKIIEQPISEFAMQVYKIHGDINKPEIDVLDKKNLPEKVLLP